MNRKEFLMSMGALAAMPLARADETPTPGAAKVRPENAYTVGKVPFKVGVAGYTYNKFKLDETLDQLKKLDVHYLTVKDFHLPMKSTDAEMAEFKRKCADAGVIGYGVGPIYMNSHEDVDRAFDYAARLGVTTIVGVPHRVVQEPKRHNVEDRAICEYVSGKCDEYRINYAIHNHGPDMPELFPTGRSAFEMVKDLSPRMGLCLDIGHDFRANMDPADSVRLYGKRLFDFHLKNVTDNSKKGGAIQLPRGRINLVDVVKALCEVNYTGVCALEYERDFSDNFAGVAESIGYFRGLMDSVCA